MSTCKGLTEQTWHIHKTGYFVAFSKAEAQIHTWKDRQRQTRHGSWYNQPVAEYVQPIRAERHPPLSEAM